MKLVIINGSPRGKSSNSDVITNWVTTEMDKNIQIEQYYAVKIHTHKEAVDAIEDNTTVLVVFPLYVDAMPGITKLFFEKLESIAHTKQYINIYFIIHSGFEGAKHCRAVERYLVYLSEHLGFNYMGTTIKPGSEGFRLMPEEYTKDIRNDFVQLSKDITKGVPFNKDVLSNLAGFETLPDEYLKNIKASDGESDYFTYLLKQNNSLENSFDKPYQKRK